MKKRHPLNDSLFSRDNGTPPSNVLPVFNPATNPTYGPTPPTTPTQTGAKLTDAEIIQAYSAISGYDPVLGVRDTGASVISALGYFKKQGIGGHRILGYTALDTQNLPHVKAAIYLFGGGVLVGLSLPNSAKNQDIWDVPAGGAKGDGAPNSWGGHCCSIPQYDDKFIYCVTWGALKKMTWAFWKAYAEEAFVAISEEFVGKKSPSGFDMATLQKDLKAIGKGAPQVLK